MTTPDLGAAEHIQRAKAELAAGDYDAAHCNALIAIAELLQANVANIYAEGVMTGGVAVADALGQTMQIIGLGLEKPQ
jgi:hypothetical protein